MNSAAQSVPQSNQPAPRGLPGKASSTLACCLGLALLVGPLAAQGLVAVDQGQQLIREKKYGEAIAVLNRAKLDHPNDAQLFFYCGLALMESGQLRQAGPEFRRAMELDPSPPEFPLLYAELQERLGQNSEASKTLLAFQNAAALESLEPPEVWLLANLYLRLDAFQDAHRALDRLESLRPGASDLHLKRGEIYLNQRDFGKAFESYERALKNPNRAAPAYYGMALSRWKEGQPSEAKTYLIRALELQPQNAELLFHLGLVSLDLQEPEEALRYLQPIEPLGGRGLPAIYNALARAYRRTGDLERSRHYFEKFGQAEAAQKDAQTTGRRADSLVRRGLEILESGDARKARELLEEALQLRSDHWTARKYLAQIYLASRAWAPALDQIRAMEALRPDDFDVKSLLARYWYDRGQPLQARPYAEAAKQLNPGDADLRNLLGNIYLSLGMRREARAEYQAAVTLAPQRQDFRLNLESVSSP